MNSHKGSYTVEFYRDYVSEFFCLDFADLGNHSSVVIAALRLVQTTKIHKRKGDWEEKENNTDTDIKGDRW